MTRNQRCWHWGMGWLLVAALGGGNGCDSDGGGGGSDATYALIFVSPDRAAADLTCTDDGDHSTTDRLEYDVSVLVDIDGIDGGAADIETLSVRLSLPDHPDIEPANRHVTSDMRVIFGAFPLPLGRDIPVRAELLDNEQQVVTTATTTVNVEIDTEDPDCLEPPASFTVAFKALTDGHVFTADDDDDDDLSNDVQVPVTAEVVGLSAGQAKLTVGELEIAVAEFGESGRVDFGLVTLPVGDGTGAPISMVVAVSLAGGPNRQEEISVSVVIDACRLSVLPAPTGGDCDLTIDDDVDPDTDGIQIELVAETNCARVAFAINGVESESHIVEDNHARETVTLNEGENTIAARASTNGGLSGEVTGVQLAADGQSPVATLNLMEGERNDFGIVGNTLVDDRLHVQIRGQSDGLEAGATVEVSIDPPLGHFDTREIVVDAEGRFAFDIEVDEYACDRTLTVAAVDMCGNGGAKSYAVCFDPVQPLASIMAPEPGATFSDSDDIRPGDDPVDEGIQVEMQVQIDDPRPAEIDYEIRVECRREGLAFSPRFTLNGDATRRSGLSNPRDGVGTVVATFRGQDAGRIWCRGMADSSPNPPRFRAEPPEYFVVLQNPTFEVISPVQGACADTGEITVAGVGQALDESNAVLRAVVTPEGDLPLPAVVLPPQGDEVYALRFGADGAPRPLADGTYSLRVNGEIEGGLPVTVVPAEAISFRVDTQAPVLRFPAPRPGEVLTGADDQNGRPEDCIQTSLQFALDDASSTEVCYVINGTVGPCLSAEQGLVETDVLTLINGENEVVITSTDCAGNQARGRATFIAECGNVPRIEVTHPAGGSRMSLAADVDPVVVGLQIDVVIETNLPEGEEFIFVASVEGGDADSYGPIAVDADGSAAQRITVRMPAVPTNEFELTLQGSLPDGGVPGPIARVIVVLVPPEMVLVDPSLGNGGDRSCVSSRVPDASAELGFQMIVEATTLRVDAGREATLVAICGENNAVTRGIVGLDGRIEFDPLTVPDVADCALRAEVTDGAGQAASAELSVHVDREAPAVVFLRPHDGVRITPLDDGDEREVPEADGIQFGATLNVCGAPARDVEVSAQPPLFGDDGYTTRLGNQVCSNVQMPQVTLPEGNGSLTARVTDECGNRTVVASNYVVDPSPIIQISTPADGGRILVGNDEGDAEGCQANLLAQFRGLGPDAEFSVCTTHEQGDGPAACDGRSSALADSCVLQGEGTQFILCPLDLREGEHTLTVVGELNDRVVSAPVTIRADCTAPRIVSIEVPQDGGDGCVNQMERDTPGRASNKASFTVEFQTDGVEPGVAVFLESVPPLSEAAAPGVVGPDGRGSFDVDLLPGVYELRVAGADEAGNPLPNVGEANDIGRRVQVETEPPTPHLLGRIAEGVCLSAADSGAEDGMVFSVLATAGGAIDEALMAEIIVDGGAPVAGEVDRDEIGFAALPLAEGGHSLTVTVRDGCGNVGSVTGFEQIDGVDDWSAPIPLTFRVDTVDPVPQIEGIADQQQFGPADDADGDTGNGFQLDAAVDFDPRDGIEPGQNVQWFSGAARLSTTPPTIEVPEDFDAPVPVRMTLPPGTYALQVRATDLCGNEGESDVVEIDVEVDGCGSSLTSFAVSPAVLGPDDGVVDGDTLRIDAAGSVDLLNPDCLLAQAQLILDGEAVTDAIAIAENGEVIFSDVAIPRGTSELQIGVTLDDETTASLVQEIIIDLDIPEPTITTPGPEPDPAVITQDRNDEEPGTQTTFVVQVAEDPVSSARWAHLYVDGVQQGEPVAVGDQNPANVSLAGVTLAPGRSVVRICVRDMADNEACAQRNVNADPAAPGGFELDAEVVNRRRTTVDLVFVAPGDDGQQGGRVAAYLVRSASVPIVDEDDWLAADPRVESAPVADPGEPESIRLDETLALNAVHHLAVRALDDVGRMGPVSTTSVDLRLQSVSFALEPRNAETWASEDLFSFLGNEASPIQGVGDVNGDGRGDAVVAIYWYNGGSFLEEWEVTLIQGAADPASALRVPLAVPVVDDAPLPGFGYYATGIGDVNRDGLADLAVVGYTENVSSFMAGLVPTYQSVVSVYFGSNNAVEMAEPDVIVTASDRQISFVTGLGNFNQLEVDGVETYDDFAIGGGSHPDGIRSIFVIAGRATQSWPATIDVGVLDAATGVTEITVPEQRPGRAMSGAGDLNGDGLTEIALSAHAGFNNVYVFAGQAPLPETYSYDADDDDHIKLAHPCPSDDPNVESRFGTYFAGGVDLDGVPGGDLVVGDRALQSLISFVQADDGNGQELHDVVNTDCVAGGFNLYGWNFDFAGDINADDSVDLIVTHQDENQATTQADILFNDGHGSFGIPGPGNSRLPNLIVDETELRKLGVTGIADFNRDGFDDVGVLVKHPGGSFEAVVYY